MMTRTKTVLLLAMAVLVSMPFVGGCNLRTTVPHMDFGTFNMRAELTREDVVLERVEGTSTTTSILGGLIEIVDRDKLKILWIIPFFTEKSTYVRDEFSDSYRLGLGMYGPQLFDSFLITTEDRAYYKALEAAPEADAVFYKRMDRKVTGFPLLWQTTTATFSGKAITLKADEPTVVRAELQKKNDEPTRSHAARAEAETAIRNINKPEKQKAESTRASLMKVIGDMNAIEEPNGVE